MKRFSMGWVLGMVLVILVTGAFSYLVYKGMPTIKLVLATFLDFAAKLFGIKK